MDAINNALTQGIVPAIIVAIYLIITKIIDTRKETVQSKMSNDIIESISSISNFLDNVTKNIINKNKDRSRIAIKLAFSDFERELFMFVRDIVITNNLDKRRNYIMQSIDIGVNGMYYNLCNNLSSFEIDGHKINNFCKEQWKDEIKSSILTLIFDENLDKIAKVTEIHVKLKVLIDNYTIYVTNKTFN